MEGQVLIMQITFSTPKLDLIKEKPLCIYQQKCLDQCHPGTVLIAKQGYKCVVKMKDILAI